MQTQRNAVRKVDNGIKFWGFFALNNLEGFEKNIFRIWVKKIGGKPWIEVFFGGGGSYFFLRKS